MQGNKNVWFENTMNIKLFFHPMKGKLLSNKKVGGNESKIKKNTHIDKHRYVAEEINTQLEENTIQLLLRNE